MANPVLTPQRWEQETDEGPAGWAAPETALTGRWISYLHP